MNKNEQIWQILKNHLPPEYEEFVLAKFEKCFDYSPMNCWNPVIADLIKIMKSLERWNDGTNYEVMQVKTKFGRLRFYATNSDRYLEGAIAMAELQCDKICPYCNSYNQQKTNSGRFVKKCEKCNG